ncbi:hypothetical protein PIB30_092885 [Stylosanthes scabra]|uniref:DUF7054 domain-containing protein n=1 Tax=Stylosanthes scabra TaxID=79078 RepID=A0ABU6QWC4_9FABA|nr:hypothetical protein [Stylosanthes scabra]
MVGTTKNGGFEKKVLMQKTKSMGKEEDHKSKNMSNRILVTINILGSSGPIRLVVNETDLISRVIETTLKSYANEDRLPQLGFDATNFFLCCPDTDFGALEPLKPIGYYGTRNFVLCKKQASPAESPSKIHNHRHNKQGITCGWKRLNKSLSFGALRFIMHCAAASGEAKA